MSEMSLGRAIRLSAWGPVILSRWTELIEGKENIVQLSVEFFTGLPEEDWEYAKYALDQVIAKRDPRIHALVMRIEIQRALQHALQHTQ